MVSDIKINYYVLEAICDKMGTYKSALENMDIALENLKTFLEAQESKAVSAVLEKINEVTITSTKKQDMLEEMIRVTGFYIKDMKDIAAPVTENVITRVDRDDIKYNLDEINRERKDFVEKMRSTIKSCRYKPGKKMAEWEKIAEQSRLTRNYNKLDNMRSYYFLPLADMVDEYIDEMYSIYNTKLFHYETTDDY